MNVHNMMEELVADCIKEYLMRHPDIDLQLEAKGRSDVMAIVLNNLPPKYVSTEKGEMYAKTQLRLQHESDVFRELSHAIKKVLETQRPKDFE